MNVNAPIKMNRVLAFYLLPGFPILPFTSTLSVLEAANEILRYQAYTWKIISADGAPVQSSTGVEVGVDASISQEFGSLGSAARPDLVFVCSGADLYQSKDQALLTWIRKASRYGIKFGGLGAGSAVLAMAGLLKGKRCSVHWRDFPSFSETFPDVSACRALFTDEEEIYSCAGGSAAIDMTLRLVGRSHGPRVIASICEYMLIDRVRSERDPQRLPLSVRIGMHNAKVLAIAEIMSANIAQPLLLSEIAERIDMSRRQIERLFTQELERSPAQYYLEIRLEKAHQLLLQTNMSVTEVALASGFTSPGHFAKRYRDLYGKAPNEERV